MRSRTFDLRVAFTELAFALAAFACGLYDAPVYVAGLASFGMLAYWNWSRRHVLRRLRGDRWVKVTAMAFLVIIAIQAGSYWLGLGIGERMS